MKAILLGAVLVVLLTAAPAGAQDSGVGPASQAGRVLIAVPAEARFTDARAERSVRRAMRRRGFTAIDAACVRAPRPRVADCTVSATDGSVWRGEATVTRAKRSHRVEYLVSGA
jgi:hypothetical protein